MRLVDPSGMMSASPSTGIDSFHPNEPGPGWSNGGMGWGNNPCVLCHDFSGGNPGDAAVAYFYQEQARADVAKNEKVRRLAISQGGDLIQELSPGHGAHVDLDWTSFGDQEGGHWYPGFFRDTIGLDKSALDKPDLFKFRLVHEMGHGYGRVPIDQAMQDAIDQRFRDVGDPFMGASHSGNGSVVFTWILYGTVKGE